MGLFDKSIRTINAAVSVNTVEYQKKFTVNMATPIARDTPVDTGRATANWKADINKEPRPNANIFDQSESARKTINAIESAIKSTKLGDDIILKNAVSSDDEAGYIIHLEKGGSKQAPTGMFKKNIVRYKQIAKATARQVLR